MYTGFDFNFLLLILFVVDFILFEWNKLNSTFEIKSCYTVVQESLSRATGVTKHGSSSTFEATVSISYLRV